MFTHAYSFEAGSDITIMTEAQLLDLVEERRRRGMSADRLAEFEAWHRAVLSSNGASSDA